MRLLVTGVCGYVGSRLAAYLRAARADWSIVGLDNLSRWGSATNVAPLRRLGVDVRIGDLRVQSDCRGLPDVDWVIDCAAIPTVTAGVIGNAVSPRQLVEHNLLGTVNMLELCRERQAGFVLLSTSRVYSIEQVRALPFEERETRLELRADAPLPPGVSAMGIDECFSTAAPISLYGATKLASESLALEYGLAFEFPVRINRCGVISGPGQFGRADQGIVAFWVYSMLLGRPLRYIGFGGTGRQVRDCITAEDVAELVCRQLEDPAREVPRVLNIGGGVEGSFSLVELTAMCEQHLGRTAVVERSGEERAFDIPYFITDARRVRDAWGWRPTHTAGELVGELCEWAARNRPLVEELLP